MAIVLKNRRIPKRIEQYPGSSPPAIFECEALSVDADPADPVWRISRIVDLGGNRIETLFAGKGLFDQICNNRESLFPPLPFINVYSTLFDGVAGEARAADGTFLDFERTQPFTMTSWVKPLTSVTMSIFDKQESPTTFKGYALVLNNRAPQLVLRNSNTTGNRLVVLSNAALTLNVWSHVAATYDGSSLASGIKIYINGAPVGTTTVYDTLTATIKNNIRFRIGRRDGATIPFNGNIDEAGIFFKEFTALEVAELFNAGKPKELSEHSQAAFLEAYWQMGDRQLFPAIPDNENSNDLTVINLPASAFVNDPAEV
jgi:hypothetical protein